MLAERERAGLHSLWETGEEVMEWWLSDRAKTDKVIDGQIETIDDLSSKNAELNEEIQQLKKDIEEQKAEIEKQKAEIAAQKEELNKQTGANIGGSFKSYTNYKCLSRNSKQWQIQTQAYTDQYGLRKIDDAYLVALGSYYGTKLGTKYQVKLVNGNVFQIVL